MKLEDLKKIGEAPEWMTIEGFQTLSRGYLLGPETPKGMWTRVSKSISGYLNRPDLEQKFFDAMWKGWLCLATPVAANSGTKRGLPISCFSVHVPDSVDGIFTTMHEIAMLSKYGGGVGSYWGDVRARGAFISGNGKSEGVIPWLKVLDSTTISVSQGQTRRGATAGYLDVDHGDIEEFLRIRRPTGDENRQCQNIHQGVCVSDEFMKKVEDGDKKSREIWKEIIRTRAETGEPYLFFKDNVNRQLPQAYINNGLKVRTSNICTEIFLHTDEDHSFVCCLSSLNLTKWDEWKDTDLVEVATYFLDGVMEEFIQKAKNIKGFERSVRFAEKSRALGLGVLGWHSLLQSKMLPFDSFESMMLNSRIFNQIKDQSHKASRRLAQEYGEPEWCVGTNMRNTHLTAIAPTASNSIISGNVSAGIEPIVANAYAQKTGKGNFVQQNPLLKKLLQEKEKDIEAVWKSILENNGSVQQLEFLSDQEKEVFLTAREINQFAIVKQAGQRQKFIDQGQSINLFFPQNASPKYIHQVHMEAWKQGLKSLYYFRSESVLKGDLSTRDYERKLEECKACEG
jgi:ribonucleoside-diphosphate reductase alpha chain